jgi:hypothetical protein
MVFIPLKPESTGNIPAQTLLKKITEADLKVM